MERCGRRHTRRANHEGLVLVVVRNSRLALHGLLTVPRATRGLAMVKENGHPPIDGELQRMCGLLTWARHFGIADATNAFGLSDVANLSALEGLEVLCPISGQHSSLLDAIAT